MSADALSSPFVMTSACAVTELAESTPQSLMGAFPHRPELVFIDDYDLGLNEERELSGWAGLLARFDDFADRHHHVGLIINTALEEGGARYENLVPDGTMVLTGPAFAPLRRQFVAEGNHRRPTTSNPDRRVAVSFGAVDGKGITSRAISATLASLPEYRIVAFVGSCASSLGALKTFAALNNSLTLHVDCANPAPVLASCDFAIGAAGVSALERCALGLATITVLTADNQRASFDALTDAKAIVPLEFDPATFDNDVGEAALKLARDESRRVSIGARAQGYCDGRGVERIADVIEEIIH